MEDDLKKRVLQLVALTEDAQYATRESAKRIDDAVKKIVALKDEIETIAKQAAAAAAVAVIKEHSRALRELNKAEMADYYKNMTEGSKKFFLAAERSENASDVSRWRQVGILFLCCFMSAFLGAFLLWCVMPEPVINYRLNSEKVASILKADIIEAVKAKPPAQRRRK